MTAPKVRVVKHDDTAGMQLQKGPQSNGVEGVAVSNLPDALKPITSKPFPFLFAETSLALAEDKLTMVRAACHAHPIAFTVVLGDSPAQDDTLPADLSHTDEIISQSVGSPNQGIHNNLDAPKTRRRMNPEPVASIPGRELDLTIHNWMGLVEEAAELTRMAMSPDKWPGRLPKLLADLILRCNVAPAATSSFPIAGRNHGEVCREHGYTAAMMEEQSRKLQVSTLSTLPKNLRAVDPGSMVPSVVALADEVDSLRINRQRFTMRL